MDQSFRYILTINGTRFEARPLGVGNSKLKLEKEGENIFFRRKLSGPLTFTESDFQALYALETSNQRCNDVYLEIERFCNGEYRHEWPGVFSLNEVKWDLSRCQATVTPKPNDLYRCVLDHYGKDHNVLQVPASIPVTANVSAAGEFEFFFNYRTDGTFDLRADRHTWAVFLEIRNWQNGLGVDQGRRANEDIMFRQVSIQPYYADFELRQEQKSEMTANGWTFLSENPTTQTVKYARPPAVPGFKPYKYSQDSDFYGKYPDLLQWNCGDLPDPTRYIVVKARPQDNCVDIRTKEQERLVTLIWEFGSFHFTRNRRMLDILLYLVNQTCPAAAPATANELSDFFTQPTNYATRRPNQLLELLLTQKSDIINSRSSEPASKGMLSLRKLTEALRAMFDVHWFLNAEGKFQIEHISYFEALGNTDLNVPKYQLHLAGKEAYEYDTTKMPRYEKLTFGEFDSDDFKEGVIEYAGACVNYEEGQDIKEKVVTDITTDLNHLLINGENVSKTGFVLMAHRFGAVTSEPGDLTGQVMPNAHLSAANLVKHYHNHRRVLPLGIRNGKSAVFASVLKTRKQVPLTIPACCDLGINPFFSFSTNIGTNGQLQDAELNLKTQQVTLNILHEAAGGGANVGTGQFDDSFDDSFL